MGKDTPGDSFPCPVSYCFGCFPHVPISITGISLLTFPITTLAALVTLALKTLTCPWILDMTLLHPVLRLRNPTMHWPQKLHQGQAQNAWVPLVKPKTKIAFSLKSQVKSRSIILPVHCLSVLSTFLLLLAANPSSLADLEAYNSVTQKNLQRDFLKWL